MKLTILKLKFCVWLNIVFENFCTFYGGDVLEKLAHVWQSFTEKDDALASFQQIAALWAGPSQVTLTFPIRLPSTFSAFILEK